MHIEVELSVSEAESMAPLMDAIKKGLSQIKHPDTWVYTVTAKDGKVTVRGPSEEQPCK